MKKQVVYYIVWDVIFILLLYLNSFINLWIKDYVSRTMDVASRIWLQPIMPVLTGCLIAWLAYANTIFQPTKKSALLEFIMVGVPALYISLLPLIYLILPGVLNGFYIPVPIWMLRDNIFHIGAIALGYEIFIFIIRMKKPSHTKALTLQ